MINVSKLKKGIVLDHIKAGKGYKVFKALKLDKIKEPVVLMQNIDSTSLKVKDVIKIETDLNLDFTVLGLIAPYITVNYIKDGNRINKFRMELPEEVIGIMKCPNPRCISNNEEIKDHKFILADKEAAEYRCEYCDTLTGYNEE